MKDNRSFVVCTLSFTYNHESYILDAINGFVAQKTSFPFVTVIVDDASIDRTPQLVQDFFYEHFDVQNSSIAYREETDYGRVLFAQHNENRNCFFAIILLKDNHYSKKKSKLSYFSRWMENSKYIALCEGDDYWISANKLQKQVDFLESHPDFTMCFHAARLLQQGVGSSAIKARFESLEEKEYTSTDVFINWIVPTASILYKRVPVCQYKIKHPEWLTRGDISLVLSCSHTGKVWGMKEQMSVYRMQPNSVSFNPRYRDQERFKLPNHYKCILINYPSVDREPVKWNIASSYYARMKCQESIWKRIIDFFLFCYWDPRLAKNKIMSHFNRIFKK